MPRKTTAALIAALGINFAMAGGALMLANLNKPAEYDASLDLASTYGETGTVAGVRADAEQGDLVVPLKAAQRGGNARVSFTCGKKVPSGREVHEGTWDQIGGAVLYRPEARSLRAVEAVFDTRSLRTDAQGLTTTVTTKEKWFDIDNHPTATFTCDTVTPADAATPSHTHDLVGTFTLNGITQPITIPAKLSFAGQALTIDAAFTILRSDYDVDKRTSSIAGTVGGVASEVEDEVELTVRVTASPDPGAVIAELAKQVEQQEEALRGLRSELKQVRGSVALFLDKTDEYEKALEAIRYSTVKEVDTSKIPARFTDESPGDQRAVEFEMILVQGDEEEGLDSFYMSEHEVTWGMMDEFMYGDDLDANKRAQLQEAGLVPSPLWGTLAKQFQVSDTAHPAMGMTRLTAESYCKWLSEKTGRRYRLPTVEEWQYALEAGGGVPTQIDEYAWHLENSPLDENSDEPLTSPAGRKKANELGIRDMLGSVAEWVTGTGEKRFVVGGAINNKPEEISESWRAVEDVPVWSASYPNLPYSRFWYVDYYYTGIRLVCEPASVAANPPKPAAE